VFVDEVLVGIDDIKRRVVIEASHDLQQSIRI
jgi:hypothetical protein